MKYIIIDSKFLHKVDFSKVWQTDLDTVRYSYDGSKFILKYVGDQPDFVYAITNDAIGLEEYTFKEIEAILQTSEWDGHTPDEGQILQYLETIEQREKWKRQN